jgi:hypothetical protein
MAKLTLLPVSFPRKAVTQGRDPVLPPRVPAFAGMTTFDAVALGFADGAAALHWVDGS